MFELKYYINSQRFPIILDGKKAFSLAIAHLILQINKILRRRKISLPLPNFSPAPAAYIIFERRANELKFATSIIAYVLLVVFIAKVN